MTISQNQTLFKKIRPGMEGSGGSTTYPGIDGATDRTVDNLLPSVLLNGDLTGQQKTANYHSTQVIITSFLSNFVFVPFCGVMTVP